MRIVPCGVSHKLNTKYGIYFYPSHRGYSPHAYIGIYAGKTVESMWRIRSVFDVELSPDGELKKEHRGGEKTNDFDNNLRCIIREALSECGYEIEAGHRFFCGKPFLTDFRKTSSGGIQGPRFLNIKEELKGLSVDLDSPEDVANSLRGRAWQ